MRIAINATFGKFFFLVHSAGVLVPLLILAIYAEAAQTDKSVWVQSGFEGFSQGEFENAGSNLYVNANGIVEMIHRWDVNNDEYVDLVLAQSHDQTEQRPTRVFDVEATKETGWDYRDMPEEGGWNSRVADLDQDGFSDLVIANGDNGLSSMLSSFICWGGKEGLGKERTDLPTLGAYDVTIADINSDGLLDLIFPSTWRDRHNPAEPQLARVYLGGPRRQFKDMSDNYNIKCVGTMRIVTSDLNNDGFLDLVLANVRSKFEKSTDSFVYWGTKDGFATERPVLLPTNSADSVVVSDMNSDGTDDIVFSGGDQIRIYWNRNGQFDSSDRTDVEHAGSKDVHCIASDVDGDGNSNLIISSEKGVQIRSGKDLNKDWVTLPITNISHVTALDLNDDKRPDLILSRMHDDQKYDTDSVIAWNSSSGFAMDRLSWVPTEGAWGSTAADFDNNGQLELVFNNTMSGHFEGIRSYIYLGNEEGTFSKESRIELPRHDGYQMCMSDLNLDNNTDVVIVGAHSPAEMRIFYGGPKGPSPDKYVRIPEINDTVTGMEVADFNRDGYLDILAVGVAYDTKPEALAKSSFIYYGSREGFSNTNVCSLENNGFGSNLGDYNRDGYLDIAFTDERDFILVYLGSANGFSKDRTWKIPCPMPVKLNSADLNADGWLDLIIGQMSHRHGRPESFCIYYGSADGFSDQRSQQYSHGYTVLGTAVSDFNHDGHLDVVASAYSSADPKNARRLPATLHWGNGKTIDMDHPLLLPANSPTAFETLDFNRDGWTDIWIACHRDDQSHIGDSLLYWNSPTGFSPTRVTRLPSTGPHGTTPRDFGNAYTREPREFYVSPVIELQGRKVDTLHWTAEVTYPSQLKFQVRSAVTGAELSESDWTGPNGVNTYFDRSGQKVHLQNLQAEFMQFKATFETPYGCPSPQLREVRIEMNTESN